MDVYTPGQGPIVVKVELFRPFRQTRPQLVAERAHGSEVSGQWEMGSGVVHLVV